MLKREIILAVFVQIMAISVFFTFWIVAKYIDIEIPFKVLFLLMFISLIAQIFTLVIFMPLARFLGLI